MIIVGHKIRLYPNRKQKILLAKSCGTARFAYNWALHNWQEQYEAGGKPNEGDLRKHLNSIKREEYPWMLDVSKCCPQRAIQNLGDAFNGFFAGVSEEPTYKKKGIDDKFYLDNISFHLKGKRIHLAKIGNVRIAENLRFEGKLLSATISRQADQWYVAINVEVEELPQPSETNKSIGIDLGVREYVDSDKVHKELPRAYRKAERKLRRLQQNLSRKKKGSNNRKKAKVKVAHCHLKVANIRNDWLHKYTTNIIKNNDIIGIEDLSVKGMSKNHHLAKSILDAGFGECKRQLIYKSVFYGRTLIQANRFYPSSKTCSSCNEKTNQKLGLHVRSWTCEHCGAAHDRDENAAINLKNGALKCAEQNAGSSTASACGEFLPLVLHGSLCNTKAPRKTRKRKKQEVSLEGNSTSEVNPAQDLLNTKP